MSRVELHQIVCTIDDEANVPMAARGIQAILGKFHDAARLRGHGADRAAAVAARTQRTFDIVLP
jgi:hypothetical protein